MNVQNTINDYLLTIVDDCLNIVEREHFVSAWFEEREYLRVNMVRLLKYAGVMVPEDLHQSSGARAFLAHTLPEVLGGKPTLNDFLLRFYEISEAAKSAERIEIIKVSELDDHVGPMGAD